ncbi:LysR family transcriptional regulator [Desulfosporosinus fructosivorans]|uniref:LysR family transcriptional regulator n=1 Tax=Desulfosporosinus fructosivorans TaxID=2018669 RepID=A0A4Z0R572_9FIRM|nr:LysR family transcriptional regulator [Desulfosporosinus fructosivorans]TGE37157.1 LysR family transcriptional regulator [Desulfosporosinus fructosivorans]
MDFKELATFMNIIESGSYSKTAKLLYISQPTATARIKSLEDDLGIKLLKRSGKGYQATEAGAVLAVYAGRLLQIQAECQEALSQIRGVYANTLRIDTTAIGTYLLPGITAKFKKNDSQTKLFFAISNTNEAIDSLLDGSVDVVLASFTPDNDNEDLCFTIVGYDTLVLVSSIDNPITQLKKVRVQDLKNENFIVREQGSNTRKIFYDWLHENGLDAGNSTEIGQPEAIYRAVAQNVGISMLSTFSLRPEDTTIKCLDLEGFPITRQINVITKKNHKKSYLISTFTKLVKEYMDELTDNGTIDF